MFFFFFFEICETLLDVIWMLYMFLAEQYHGIYYLSFQVDVQEYGIHL